VLALGRELSRKAIHLGSAVLPIGWAVGWLTSGDVRSLLAAALVVAVMVEVARSTSASFARVFDRSVGGMLRPHERTNITGASWLAASMLAAVVLLPAPVAIVALWAASVGDGSASVVGRLANRLRSTVRNGKTIVGSLACAVTTAAGVLWFTDATIAISLLVGVATAVAERPAISLDDNVRVTVAAGLAAWALGVA